MRALRNLGWCFALAAVAACSRPAPPQFRTLNAVELRGADLRTGTIHLTATAEFHNPNGIGLNVTALELVVLLDGTEAARVKEGAATATSAAAHTDFDLPIRVELPLDAVADALRGEDQSLLGGLLAGKQLDVQVDGWVRFKLGAIELKAPVHHREQVEIRL